MEVRTNSQKDGESLADHEEGLLVKEDSSVWSALPRTMMDEGKSSISLVGTGWDVSLPR